MYSRLQVTVDKRNISLSWEKHSSFTQRIQSLPAPFCSVICCSVWCSLGDSCKNVIQYTSLSFHRCSFWYIHVTRTRMRTHTLCVSICLTLSLPPTTHSMLYKSYINASSTPFWHSHTSSESHYTNQEYLHVTLTLLSYTIYCIWTGIDIQK